MGSRGITLVGLGLVIAAFAALVGISLTGALVYYVTPSELAADPQPGSVRLYGIVEPGTTEWDTTSSTLSFRITDGTRSVGVRTSALPTGLFRDGIGVVLAGRSSGPETFIADEVLVKHSEVYAPLRPGETIPPGLLDTIRGDGP